MNASLDSETECFGADDRGASSGRGGSTQGDFGSLAVVYESGRPKHVLVPVEQYERLEAEARNARMLAKFRDPATKWSPTDELGLKLAGNRIAVARKAKSLTQKQLAAKLKLPQSMISRIERNPDRSTLKTLKKIAAALGVDIKALV